MEAVSKWMLTDEEKDSFIDTLMPHLPALRRQAEISQEELANLLGISRQTYSAIERKIRRMSWSTYLTLVLFFDHNLKTHKMIHTLGLFPKELVIRFNEGVDLQNFEISDFLGDDAQDIIERLDERAKQTIYSMIMMEYARCTQLPSEAVIKSFGGVSYVKKSDRTRKQDAAKALKAIKHSAYE